jgi:hypothetical protein
MKKFIDIELVFMVDHRYQARSRHLESTDNKSFPLALKRVCKAMVFSMCCMVHTCVCTTTKALGWWPAYASMWNQLEGLIIPFVLQFSCPHPYFVCCTLLPVQLPCSSCTLSPCGPETTVICHLLRVYVRAPATGFLWSAHSTSLGITCYNDVSSCSWFVHSAVYTILVS